MLYNRTIQSPGSELLPPSAEPMFPADIRDEEKVLVKAPIAPTPNDKRFWLVADGYSEHPNETNSAWKNKPGGGFGRGKGLGSLPGVCIFEFEPVQPERAFPDFWEAYGLWITSTRLLNLLHEIDPDALESRPINMKDPRGLVLSDDYHFVDIVRCISAVDYANSNILYVGGGVMSDGTRFEPRAGRYMSARLLPDIDPSIGIFRHRDRRAFVSARAAERIQTEKPSIRNISFTLPSAGF